MASAGFNRWLLTWVLLLACGCAQAGLRVRATSLVVPGVELGDLSAEVKVDASGQARLHVTIARVTVPAMGWREVGLTLDGSPQRAAGGRWLFTGQVRSRGAPGAALANAELKLVFDRAGGTLEVAVSQGKGSLRALMPLDQTSHLQFRLAAVPLAWLDGVLRSMWSPGRITGGVVTGDVAVDVGEDGARVSGLVNASAVGLDSKTGEIAAEQLGLAGRFRFAAGAAPAFSFDGALQGGQLLLGPLYAQLPTHAANLHVAVSLPPTGIRIDALDFDDPDALRLAGSLTFSADGRLRDVALDRVAAQFPAAYTRYATTLVANLAGLHELRSSGSIAGSVQLANGKLQALDLTAKRLTLDDGGQLLGVKGLDGRLDWRAGMTRPPTALAWDGLSVYRLAFGPARLALADRNGTLTLLNPLRASLFGGSFQLGRFAWRPDAIDAQRLSASLAVTDVDLGALCKALGWPVFGGKLGGAVPDLRYHGDQLVFAGGLSLDAFKGSVSVTNLSMQAPFSADPVLAADIDMRQLDLAQLTSAFDFGRITGELDGEIHGLRLVAWKPTAFSASLRAERGGRISQDAIRDLTEVGGGGIVGGLQGMALRLFQHFRYTRIMLSCVLEAGVCRMGGIGPAEDSPNGGYTIVEGRGLPRITVIGHQNAVDWATLVSRLQSATQGDGAPVVE